MKPQHISTLSNAALRMLADIAAAKPLKQTKPELLAELRAADLITASAPPRLSEAGSAHLARLKAQAEGLDPFRAQHLGLIAGDVLVDARESPLAWLARRKGKDGVALILPHQFLAGERLRADFTRAQMTPRVTSNWSAAVSSGRRGEVGIAMSDTIIAARQRVQLAARAVGPEFSGLLLDVCCFLKKLDAVETERQWPVRSAKVVLQLGLEKLARHYGLRGEISGPGARRNRKRGQAQMFLRFRFFDHAGNVLRHCRA